VGSTDRSPSTWLRHLAVVASGYPSPAQPMHGTFVREFARAVVRAGAGCTVVHPVPVHEAAGPRNGYPRQEAEIVTGTNRELRVLRPRFVSLSTRRWFPRLGPLNAARFTFGQFTAAADRALIADRSQPDAIYGHFLFLAGAAAVRIGTKLGVPAFPGVGEGELWTLRPYGLSMARKELSGAAGFIVNSAAGKEMVTEALGLPGERFGVFPNGVDHERFRPLDQAASRAKFGLPANLFLVCAVGNFLEKKGVARVAQAIDGLEGVGGVYAGSGPVPPVADNTVFCGRVSHEDMPALLSACDVFALPTVIEGSSNAIVEAMACGLPIISSAGRFNDDLLAGTLAVRIDPHDVASLRDAVSRMKANADLRARVAASTLRRGVELNADGRASRILDFMTMVGGAGPSPGGAFLRAQAVRLAC